MEVSKILNAGILDIIFEGKNKEYGAYELRKSYNKRLRLSLLVMIGLVLLMFSGLLFADSGKIIVTQIYEIPPTELEPITDPVEPPVVPPPPAVKPPDVMERRHLDIVVVPDHKVPPQEEIPENKDLENARLTLINKDGVATTDIIAPPASEAAAGKGIIEPPKKANPDSVFLKVEMESYYPGGTEAWRRFLIKNLSNNYPEEAVEKGIEGRVLVQFIVDKNGSVSNVRAVSGPKELHDLATKVIKKSGKWQPAQQNGQIVNSYKSQPIDFQLGEQ